MKTAIIITGHTRSFARCLPNLHWFVFRHFPSADFFFSTVKDGDSKDAELLRAKYPNSQVEIEAVEAQPEMILPDGCPEEWVRGRNYTHEPYAISVPPQHVMAQLWQLERGWELYEDRKRHDHSLVIRCRPDIWFHSFKKPPLIASEDEGVAFLPWWGRFGGCNDRFALLRPTAAYFYFRTFSRTPNLWANGCPIHPESLVHASMHEAGCSVIDDMKAEFSTLRVNGELRPPEISPIDMTHFMGR